MTEKSEKAFKREDMEKVKKEMSGNKLLMPVAFVFLGVAAYAVFNDQVKLYGPVKEADLKTFGAKLQFLGRYLVLHAFWLFIALMNVGRFRGTTPAMNPLSGFEHLTAKANKILTNSIETSVFSLFTQVAFISLVRASYVLRVIPLINVLYLVGRVAFLLGYPTKRGFGYLVSSLPSTVTMFYTLYQFVLFVIN